MTVTTECGYIGTMENEFYQKYLDRKSHWEKLNAEALAETRRIIRAKVRRTDSDDAYDEYNAVICGRPLNNWNL